MPDESGVDLWRCVECGRWSSAKRRPLRHTRSVVVSDGEYDQIRETRICGPFSRFVATPTGEVGPRLPEHGRVIEEFPIIEDPNAGIEVPW